MNTFPPNIDQEAVGTISSNKCRQVNYIYTASSSSPNSSSSPYSSFTSTTSLTDQEIDAIEAEYKDVVLNEWEPDDEPDEDTRPEDGSWITNDETEDEAHYDEFAHAQSDLGNISAAPITLHPLVAGSTTTFSNLQLNAILNKPAPSFINPSFGGSLAPGSIDGVEPVTTRSANQNAQDQVFCATTTASRSATTILTFNPSVSTKKEVVADYSKLNRCELAELEAHADLLQPGQLYQLHTFKRKVECCPNQFPDSDRYLNLSSLLTFSLPARSLGKYSKCCIKSKNRPGKCRLHKYCSHCSWVAGQKAALTYVPAFDRGTWHWLTGTFNGSLGLETPAQVYGWLTVWDAYKSALLNLVEDGDVRGVFWTEELHINSMLPINVLPHIHAVVEADDLDVTMQSKLKDLVSKALHREIAETLEPKLDLKPIRTGLDLYNCLHYAVKPIDLVKPYEKDWARASQDNRRYATLLNSNLTDLVQGYALVTNGRKKINVAGNLNQKTRKKFIGVLKRDHKHYHNDLKLLKSRPEREETIQ